MNLKDIDKEKLKLILDGIGAILMIGTVCLIAIMAGYKYFIK